MKYFWFVLIFLISFVIFMILEYGRFTTLITELIHPIIFSTISSWIFILPSSRYTILLFSLFSFLVMAVFYLFQLVEIANWIGSLGFGILVITVVSCLPQLIKKGFIEKF